MSALGDMSWALFGDTIRIRITNCIVWVRHMDVFCVVIGG